jgi:Haemolysin-III related.
MWNVLPVNAIIFLIVEGLLYSLGTIFYSKDLDYPYFHSIWHLFVLGGNISHALVLWFII